MSRGGRFLLRISIAILIVASGGALILERRRLNSDQALREEASLSKMMALEILVNLPSARSGDTESDPLNRIVGSVRVLSSKDPDPLCDVFGRRFAWKRVAGAIKVYSLGRNAIDEHGAGDDIAAPGEMSMHEKLELASDYMESDSIVECLVQIAENGLGAKNEGEVAVFLEKHAYNKLLGADPSEKINSFLLWERKSRGRLVWRYEDSRVAYR